ncbi:sugar ABC transporter ATP-binding protein [Litorilinea aerophila]|uniref:Sugar ABC transporter ATP-binding protein n=1 Tax=Litorilinea aerophila TaxID=1204385 RepID=A0A540VJH4_9CHLR
MTEGIREQVQEAHLPEAQPAQDDVILRAENITKLFPGTVALDKVNFNVYRGKVNVLVGENGAGKSTLMKIIAGVEQATEGRLLLDGREIQINSVADAERHGIGIIHQELSLFPNLSVAENIFMGREIKKNGLLIDEATQRERARRLIEGLQQRIDPDDIVGNLRIGQQQIVEIARALAQERRILIMDEPTSALSTAEVEILFGVINDLKAHGVSIVYISHKMDELLRIGDYVTVLRDGRVRAERPIKEVDMAWIVEQMIGKRAAQFHLHSRQVGDEILRVEDVTLPRVGGGYTLDHVSFSLRRGEILGIYGLMGAGRSELLECLMGLHPEASGRYWLGGQEIKKNTVADRIGLGLILIPEDRQREGLVQTMSVADNMLLASLKRYVSAFFLSRKKEEHAVNTMIRELLLKVADPGQIITSLSGGNQQKVIVAKGLLTTPKVLLLDEPTRGIDVGAKAEMFDIISRLAAQGLGIILVSSELKEILGMSDRILVMSKGRITGEFSRETATEEGLVAASAVGHGMKEKELEARTNGSRQLDSHA